MEEEKDDLFIDDSQRNLANVKKAAWRDLDFCPRW